MKNWFMFHENTREVLFNIGKEQLYDCEKKLEIDVVTPVGETFW